MRVVFVSMGAENRASSRLRVYGWLPHLKECGYRCVVLPYHSVATSQGEGWLAGQSPRIAAFLGGPSLWRRLAAASQDADWVVFQEVLPPRRVLERLKAGGVRIGFDFSDPVHLANGPDHKLHHRWVHRLVTLPRFRAMLRIAEWAMIENDLLRPIVAAAGTRVEALRGPVDSDIYVPRDRPNGDGRVVLGWAGSRGTLPFLSPLFPTLKRLAAKGLDFELVVFGVEEPVHVEGVRVRVVPWSLEAEPRVIAQFDVGLAYLPDTPWTRYRGGAKLILYQSCGVPTIAAPTGIGSQVLRDEETGLLAKDLESWEQALERLLIDAELRGRLGATAREVAVSRYSYRAYLPLYQELLGEPSGSGSESPTPLQ